MSGCVCQRFGQRQITSHSTFGIEVSTVKIMVTGRRAGEIQIEVERTLTVNVKRTGEIGIRKAIGARKSDIRAQFLLEAVMLSGIGGVLGILAGGGISMTARALASIPATVSPFWVVMGVAISVGVGLFFGYYPANRAANLDPIVCLRYE